MNNANWIESPTIEYVGMLVRAW